jgi:hypothetical protein
MLAISFYKEIQDLKSPGYAHAKPFVVPMTVATGLLGE